MWTSETGMFAAKLSKIWTFPVFHYLNNWTSDELPGTDNRSRMDFARQKHVFHLCLNSSIKKKKEKKNLGVNWRCSCDKYIQEDLRVDCFAETEAIVYYYTCTEKRRLSHTIVANSRCTNQNLGTKFNLWIVYWIHNLQVNVCEGELANRRYHKTKVKNNLQLNRPLKWL